MSAVARTVDAVAPSARWNALTIYAQHIDERLTRLLVESRISVRSVMNIGRNRVGDRGAEQLAWSPRFRNLAILDLSDNALGDTVSGHRGVDQRAARLSGITSKRGDSVRSRRAVCIARAVAIAASRHGVEPCQNATGMGATAGRGGHAGVV